MKTATVCIGNSDNKLTQKEWSEFVLDIKRAVARFAGEIYFDGCSSSDSEFQNACWVLSIKEENCNNFEYWIKMVREGYKQDSLALVYGETKFI